MRFPASIRPAEWLVVAFTLAYMIIWLAASLVSGNGEFVMYFGVMCVLVVAVGAVHLRIGFHLLTLWGLSIWGLLHMAGGLVPIPRAWPVEAGSYVLYSLWLIPGWLKYDQVVHAYGFALVTWVCWQGLERAFSDHGIKLRPTLGLLTLCVAGGMGFGAANEVVEFVAVLTLPGTNVGGYENTGWDLVANLTGCLISAAAIALAGRKSVGSG